MRKTAPLLALLVLTTAACGSQTEEQKAVSAALDRTVAALESGDLKALWEISSPQAQQRILKLYDKLARAMKKVDTAFAPPMRAAARRALGEDEFEGIEEGDPDIGPKLLARLIDPKKLDLSEEARDGLVSVGATITGDEATIHTRSEEHFTFKRTDDGWRSQLILDLMEHTQLATRFEENADSVLATAKRHEDAWRANRDPTTPHGAYNMVRLALKQKPPDGAVLYTLLDKDARLSIHAALKESRYPQKLIMRRTAKNKRSEAYAEHGLEIYAQSTSDKQLYSAWAATKEFRPPVPSTAPPMRIDGKLEDGEVKVITDDEKEIAMIKEQDGYWHVAGQTPLLDKALTEPMKALMVKLTTEPEETPGEAPKPDEPKK